MIASLKRGVQRIALNLLRRITGQPLVAVVSSRAADLQTPRVKLGQSERAGPIRVLLVCHMPALWSMFESIYEAMRADAGFAVTVVAMPYTHSTIGAGRYEDLGVLAYLADRKAKVIQGFDADTKKGVDPVSLRPDYVFYQTPYDNLPYSWSAKRVASFARICYVPYGTTLFAGQVEEIVHPEAFFSVARIVFAENSIGRDLLVSKFEDRSWFRKNSIILTGSPKLDFASDASPSSARCWRRGAADNTRRVLWTPRWWTADGTCHFFEYREFFARYCADNSDVDFTFRPHPLCFQNFLSTGELSAQDLDRMRTDYRNSPNMLIDEGGEYRDTFLTSDVLITDVSSMMVEYLVTGKPIIYTHRVDQFNKLGRELSEGFYWVRNVEELRRVMDMLKGGSDPLRAKRSEVRDRLLFTPPGGSGQRIKDAIAADAILD